MLAFICFKYLLMGIERTTNLKVSEGEKNNITWVTRLKLEGCPTKFFCSFFWLLGKNMNNFPEHNLFIFNSQIQSLPNSRMITVWIECIHMHKHICHEWIFLLTWKLVHLNWSTFGKLNTTLSQKSGSRLTSKSIWAKHYHTMFQVCWQPFFTCVVS